MYIVLVLNSQIPPALPWTHTVRCFFLKQPVWYKDKDRHWDPELNQQPDGGAVQVSFLLQLLLQLLWLQRFPGHLRGFWSKQYCRLFMCLSPLCLCHSVWFYKHLAIYFFISIWLGLPPTPVILIEPSTPPMREKNLKLGMDQRDPVVLRHKFRNWYIYQSAW